jgi:hypothetical protein
VNILQMFVETLFFYHPAVWWVSSRIRYERELCCDDLAVSSSGDAVAYARALAQLERLRPAMPSLAMGSTEGPSFTAFSDCWNSPDREWSVETRLCFRLAGRHSLPEFLHEYGKGPGASTAARAIQ